MGPDQHTLPPTSKYVGGRGLQTILASVTVSLMGVDNMSNFEYDTPELAEKYDIMSDPQYEAGMKLVDMLGLNTGDHVLDLGCGTGRLTLYTARKVGLTGKVVGIDPASLRIEIANKKLAADRISNVEFDVGGSDDLKDFTGDMFHAAYLSAVLHWIPDKNAAAEQLFRVIRPGGKIGIAAEDGKYELPIERAIYQRLAREPNGSKFGDLDDIKKSLSGIRKSVNREEIEQILRTAGFRDIDVRASTQKIRWATAAEFVEFMDASSFGSYRQFLPDSIMDDVRKDIEAGMEKMMTPNGLEVTRNPVYIIAKKP